MYQRLICGFLGALLLCAGSASAVTKTWTGGSANDDNWMTPENWGGTAPSAGDDLVFNGTNRLTPYNNYTNTSFKSLTFNAGGFTISGNDLLLNSGPYAPMIANNTGTNALNLNIVFRSGQNAQFITIATGTMLTIGQAGNTITFDGSFNLGPPSPSSTLFITANGTGICAVNSAIVDASYGDKSVKVNQGPPVTTGTIKLSGASTFSGGMDFNGGTLEFGASSSPLGGTPVSGPVGTGSLILHNGITVQASVAVVISNLITAAGGSFKNIVIAGVNDLTLGSATGNIDFNTGGPDFSITNTGITTFAGSLTGINNFLTKNGPGTLVLAAQSPNPGAPTPNSPGDLLFNAGTLKLAVNNAWFSSIALSAGATLDVNGVTDAIGALRDGTGGGGSVLLNGGTLSIFADKDKTWTGVISGNGNVYDTHGGYNGWLWGAQQTYHGITGISGGVAGNGNNVTLKMAITNALPADTVLTLGNADNTFGILDLNSFSQTIGGLVSSGISTANNIENTAYQSPAATLTINVPSGQTYTYAGNLIPLDNDHGELVKLVKDGPGTQVLNTGVSHLGNTLPDGVTVKAGTLVLNGSNVGQFGFHTFTTVNGTGTLSGTGTVEDVTVAGSGSVSPGDSSVPGGVGIFSGRNANFTGGGNLLIQINGYTTFGADYDRLKLSGNVALGGTSVLTLDLTGVTAEGAAVGVVASASNVGLTQFSKVNVINNPNFDATVTYSATSIDVNVFDIKPALIRVETQADGNGTVVPAQNLAQGDTLTVYAIVRSASGRFLSNSAASWSLPVKSGGVMDSDLVAAPDMMSAVLTGNLLGSAIIEASVSGLILVDSGTIRVVRPATQVQVESAVDGTGSLVPLQNLQSGNSLTVYAITRNDDGDFLKNVAASWSLQNKSGDIMDGDLAPNPVDGKSAVLTGHLTGSAQIQAAFGGLTPLDSGIITVVPGAPITVQVETAANGSGSVVQAQPLTSGNAITVFSIRRDLAGNFIDNVAAGNWLLATKSGGVADLDLVSTDPRSATFTAKLLGTATIRAVSDTLTSVDSGLITVTAGAAVVVQVETAADGGGSGVQDTTLVSGDVLTVYSVSRDAAGNFVENVAASWTLTGITPDVVSSDLAPNGGSAVFSANLPGSARIRADFDGLSAVESGTITVLAAPPVQVGVETAADGSGSILTDQTIFSGTSITVYAVTRDATGKFVANILPDSWMLAEVQPNVSQSDLSINFGGKSAVFTGKLAGSAKIHVESGSLTPVDSGTITVVPVTATVRVETADDGTGSLVPSQSLAQGLSITVYAISRNDSGQFLDNVVSSWSMINTSGLVSTSNLHVSADGKSAVFTANLAGSGQIQAASAGLTPVPSGVITVEPGPVTKVRAELVPTGNSGVVPAQSLASGALLTFYAIGYDASNQFVGNIAASWSLLNTTGGVMQSDLLPSPDGKNATFTGKLVGSAVVHPFSTGIGSIDTGIITVQPGTASQLIVETAANDSGSVVPEQNVPSGTSFTVFAVSRDAAGNFINNVPAGTWALVNQTGAGDSILTPNADMMSAVFTAGSFTGSVQIEADDGSGVTPVPSGLLTVVHQPSRVLVETAADGLGTLVADQDLEAGNSITVFAISRDDLGNFVANVTASWSLSIKTLGVVDGDLIAGGMSAVFTGHVPGTGVIHAASGMLTSFDSGIITVVLGAATQVRVETAGDGTGSVLQAQDVPSGTSLTVFAVSRDVVGNFVANVAANWSLAGFTGGVTNSDLSISSGTSTVFTGHVAGTAAIHALSGTLASVDSGTLTVIAGDPAQVLVETAANGSGSVVPAQMVPSGASFTVFAVSRDASGNFTGIVAANWSMRSTSGGVTSSDLSVGSGTNTVFTGHLAGTGTIHATSGALATTDSGTITVSAGAASQVRVETQADGKGTVVAAQNLASGTSITVFAISRDASNNFIANVVAAWTVVNASGGVANSDLSAGSGMSTVFTGHVVGSGQMHAVSGGLAPGNSGVITVVAGIAVSLQVETAANGSGTVVPAQTLLSGASLSVFAISRDAAGNVSNVAAVWSLNNLSGSVVAGDLAPSGDNRNAVFTANLSGTAQIQAVFGAFTSISGTITVNSPPVINSPPTVSPSSAGVGQSVTFTVAATDAGDTLTFAWLFDDGTAAAGPSVTHVFTMPGTHTATVTVTDNHGAAATATATVTVNATLYVTGNPDDTGIDNDGDGFSDKLEAAVNTSLTGAADPNDGAKTPFDKNGKATASLTLAVKSLSIKLNFQTPLKDSIQLKGSLPLAASVLPLTGHKVIVDVGGYIAAYTLDARGKSPKSKTTSFTIGAKPNKKTGLSNYSFKVLKSTVASFFADDGMTVSAAANTLVNIPVTVLFADTGYQAIRRQHFTQTKGKTGKTTP